MESVLRITCPATKTTTKCISSTYRYTRKLYIAQHVVMDLHDRTVAPNVKFMYIIASRYYRGDVLYATRTTTIVLLIYCHFLFGGVLSSHPGT